MKATRKIQIMKRNLWLLGFLGIIILHLASCSSSDDPIPEPDPDPVVEPEPQPDKMEKVSPHQLLVTPAENYTQKVKTLVIVYLPSNGGISLDFELTGINSSISSMKKKVEMMNIQAKFMLEEGSKYLGYKNTDAHPFLGYEIVDYIYVYAPFKKGKPANNQHTIYFPDYNDVANTVGLEDYVNNQGVTEVWLWGWHHKQIAPVESNMASKLTGDISNSYRQEDDLPKYDHSYVLYNYNYGRSACEAVHNHIHQFESIFKYANRRTNNSEAFFLKNFCGWGGSDENPYEVAPIGRVGDCHHPPNTTKDYDYRNETLVESDIMDWKPDGSGAKTKVNCHTWGDHNYVWPESYQMSDAAKMEAHWYIFWMQTVPGANNQLSHQGKPLTNWFMYKGNWDQAIGSKQKLFE